MTTTTQALIIKEVCFNGDTLVAVQDEQTNEIYAGVSWVCNGLGFSKGQKDRQTENVQRNDVLSRGCRKFAAGVFDPNNETIAILIEFLPLWLAKIAITPTVKRDNPETAKKLIEYQLRAKDVLAAAFLPQPQRQSVAIPTYPELLRLHADTLEENERLKEREKTLLPRAKGYDLIVESDGLQYIGDFAKAMNWGRNRLCGFLREQKIFMPGSSIPYQRYCNDGCFDVKYTSKGGHSFPFTLVSPKGMDFIVRKVQECGIMGGLLDGSGVME